MIEKAPINRLPEGLLGFLDIKSMGKNPSTLLDQVQAIISLEPFYALASISSSFSRAAGPAVTNVFETFTTPAYTNAGAALPETVPPQEIWLVTNFSVNATGTVVPTVLPAFLDTSGTSQVCPAFMHQSTVGLSCDSTAVRPFLVPSGARLAVLIRNLALNGLLSVTMRVMRLVQ